MAKIDDIIAQVPDKELKLRLQAALSDMRKRQRFGLVYEEHVPESTSLLRFPIQQGSLVQPRQREGQADVYLVKEIKGDKALIEPVHGNAPEQWIALTELLTVKRFGEPIFPALTPIGALQCGAAEQPHHAVINGENFHTLQLLVYLFEAQVDCIYIDPPYNTGARDWKYNNHYVDNNDSWRHSKWLSFMEKRLKLAKRLLKPDGVLIVTIDEHEVHHLGMLLEKIFPTHLRYTVTAVINPKGTFKQNFGRVDEQIFFVVPDLESDVIVPRPVEDGDVDTHGEELAQLVEKMANSISDTKRKALEASLGPEEAQLLESLLEKRVDSQAQDAEELDEEGIESEGYEDWFLRRRGQQSSYRHQRPNQFFAMLVDINSKEVVGIGPALAKDDSYDVIEANGIITVYPIDNEGHERVWRYSRETMDKYVKAKEIVVGRYNKKTRSWTLNHRKLKKNVRRLKTVWWEKRHDAGVHGTNVVNNLLGKRGLFPFPKSVYAVQDALAAVVRNRPNALILDFFAGSGTTLHATALINAEDGGSRRSILVTNNEVEDKLVKELNSQHIYRGDEEFEAHGIFSLVTKPRCEAAISGRRHDGTPVPGKHVTGRPFAQGFPENIQFFRVDYLDPDDVDMGTQFQAIFPSLWLSAGGKGKLDLASVDTTDMLVSAPYAVLFKEELFRRFCRSVAEDQSVTHVWIVTDSEDAFAEMRASLPQRVTTSMLYRDYLRNFRINTRQGA